MTIIQIREKFTAASLSAGHRRNTLKTYLPIVEDFCRMMKAGTITGPQGYFDHLAQVKKLAPKSVRHAANPLKFLYEKVLEKEFGTYRLPKVSKNRRIPCELSHADIINILMRLSRLPRLQAATLYGCGPRIECELLQLRLKDIHLADGMMIIQSGKGDKSRAVRLPRSILPEIEDQIRRCKRQWQADQAQGIRTPHQDDSLMRKLGNRTFKTLPWYWLFPSRTVQPNGDRWHGTTSALSRELKTVAAELGILQRVHPHAFRHSYATNLLRTGTDIRTIQQQLGHTNVETTEIYAHAMGAKGVESPLDHVAPTIIQFPTYVPCVASQ